MKNVLSVLKDHTMQIVLLLVVIFFTITTNGQMLSPSSFNSLIAQNAYVYVLAVGMLMCMLTGGNIDLAVGSIVCFIGAIGAILMVNMGWPLWLALIIMPVIGLAIGSLVGWLIAYLDVPPWIATLGGYLAFRGWGTALLNGLTIGGLPDGFVKMFSGYLPSPKIGALNLTAIILGAVTIVVFVVLQVRSRNNKISKGYEVEKKSAIISRCVIISLIIGYVCYKLAAYKGIQLYLVWVAVILLVYNFIISSTSFGRYFYTIGGNREATRLSGVDTRKIYFFAYLNMAFLTVIATWMTMARLTAANPTAGTNYEMDAIAACVVGGVSAYGGSGSVFGMVVGATLIGVINLGMSLMGIDANWQKIVKGIVLLAAVVFDIKVNAKKNATK